MTASADDNRRWREIADAVRLLNATHDGPAPMAEITRIAERHLAKPSDVLAVQRWHRDKGEIVFPDDISPYVRPRPVALAGLDHIDDLPHEAPDGRPIESAMIECDRCGRRVHSKGIGAHQRGNQCTPQTAEPDTAVGASAPPAAGEDEPQPPADTPATCPAWLMDAMDVRHTCAKPAGHDRLHLCDGDPHAAGPGRCGYLWSDEVTFTAAGEAAPAECGAGMADGDGGHLCGLGEDHDGDHECRTPRHPHCTTSWPDPAFAPWDDHEPAETPTPVDTVDPPGVIDIQFPMTPEAVHEVAGIMADLDAPHSIAPLSAAEQAQASDMALVSDAVLALTMLGDQIPDVLRTQHGLALNHVIALHAALRDHHRNADLIAERAVLAARLAEIDQALAPADDTGPEEDDAPAERVPTLAPTPGVLGGGRAPCPDCGKEFYIRGLPRHRAIHKKKRGAA